MQENDKFKEITGNILRNFEADPPTGMWNRIESGLQRRKRRIILFRYSSIAATIILLIALGVTYLNSPDNFDKNEKLTAHLESKKDTATQAKTNKAEIDLKAKSSLPEKKSPAAIKKIPDTDKAVKIENTGKPTRQRKIYQNRTNTGHLAENKNTGNQAQEPFIIDVFKEDIAAVTQKEDKSVEKDITSPEQNIKIEDIPEIQPQIKLTDEDLAMILNPPAAVSEPEAPGRNWSLGLAYAVVSGADYTKESALLTEGGREYSYDKFSASIANGTSYFEEVENAIHEAPLSIGFIVDKQVGKRLSFETGIQYTRLKFKVKTNELDPFYREYRNELNYLGIPAGIRYSFIQKKKYDFYVLQWIVLEKGISGTWYTDTYNNDILVSSESAGTHIRGMQLSSITGLGGQMKIAGKFYLFGQGGAQVFYLNKTQPYNLRSTKKIWPSFQAGLRMKLTER